MQQFKQSADRQEKAVILTGPIEQDLVFLQLNCHDDIANGFQPSRIESGKEWVLSEQLLFIGYLFAGLNGFTDGWLDWSERPINTWA